ncbi:OTU-domain-containing protein [Gloeophyllum trabeum ATCC 11539]|uniref:Ubiquitin thioesterase OTU n=1 Tax=Gloeophyllum trabeum (strain ATCC 11539 / FP-39264 / Madison 617) TaxID=670483 RepID=S7QE18_GLOTA|nr:OTU-domain-containing protein [Gloeophyllum trabeum ATCC 11539]EPQ58041.1 OTU-domain-containing protein [Gloeophyllum trabeum ATCC 11539]
MAPIRLRHPKGVSTIQVDLDSFTVQDLQQEIFAVSEIPPSLQDLKAGYPPQTLTVIPELPLESLGLKPGDQLIVNSKPGAAPQTAPAPAPARAPSAPSSGNATLGRSSVPRIPPSSGTVSSGPDYVETDNGTLVHRVVPDDNSCLFSSIALVFHQNIGKAQEMRKIIADAIRADIITYSEAILGRPRDDYIATILKPASWGGAIELAIFARYFSTEIASIDVETGRIDQFTPPPEADSGNRCILIYSGIHYDAASLAPTPDAPTEFHQTVFPIISNGDDDPILKAGKDLAAILRAKRAYTNTATFDLKCQQCGQGLKGEKEACAHAMQTGHTQFGEY